MSKLQRIIDQASIQINHLSHPNSQILQDQLSAIQESTRVEITQDLIYQINSLLDAIQEAKLQLKAETQITENLKIAEQNIFNTIHRLIDNNSNLRINPALNLILEKNSIEELISFIQSGYLRMYNNTKEGKKLEKQIQKYIKIKNQLTSFNMIEHHVQFEVSRFSIDDFIEPITQVTQDTQVTHITLPEPIITIDLESLEDKAIPTQSKPAKNLFKFLGISTLLLGATTYFFASNNNQHATTNNVQNTQTQPSSPQIRWGILNPSLNRKLDIFKAREFLISVTKRSPEQDPNFDLSQFCNYETLINVNNNKSILMKSEPNGNLNSTACIFNRESHSAYMMDSEEAISTLNLDEFKIQEIKMLDNDALILEILSITGLKQTLDNIRTEPKRAILIENLSTQTIQEVTNLRSIDDLHIYPEIVKKIIATGLVTNKKVYSTSVKYSESNFTILDGTDNNPDSIMILHFQTDILYPNSLIVEFSNIVEF